MKSSIEPLLSCCAELARRPEFDTYEQGTRFVLATVALRAFTGRGLFDLESEASGVPGWDMLSKSLSHLKQSVQSDLFAGFQEQALEKLVELHVFQRLWRNSLSITPESIGIVYEHIIDRDQAKRAGVFYTPEATVKSIVDRALDPICREALSRRKDFFVLDPACGGGAFLVAALRFLRQASGLSDDDTVAACELVESNLFGIDRDPLAIECSKIALLLEVYSSKQRTLFQSGGKQIPSFNLLVANSLIDTDDLARDTPQETMDELLPCTLSEAFSQIKSQGGFDAIIGNPPYGISRDEKISARENKILQTRYADYRNGKLNKYMLFMARGFELLRPGGRLSYIVPNSWLGIRSAYKLRTRFLEQHALESVELVGSKIFADPSLECVIFTLRKENPPAAIAVQSEQSQFHITHEACLQLPDAIIPLEWSEDIAELFAHLNNHCISLAKHPLGYQPLIALQAYAQGKGSPEQTSEDVRNHVYHSQTKHNQDYWPYLVGKDISRYQHKWSGSYLRYGKCLAEPQTLSRFQGPRIALREITGTAPHRFIGTYLEDTALYNKSVLHVLPIEKGPISQPADLRMKALLGVLNSRLASLIVSIQGRKIQRKLFPKIVNDDLKDFPLPIDLEKNLKPLAELVAKRLKVPSSDKELIEKLEKKIEECVFNTYKIPERFLSLV